jgi:hypothetical protein
MSQEREDYADRDLPPPRAPLGWRRRWLLLAVGVLALGLALAWEFVPIQVIIWDGEFPLSVEVTAEGDPPRRVSCQVYPWPEAAERDHAAAELHETTWTPVTAADPYTGQPLVVRVRCSGRESPLGRELSWYQFRYLVVSAEWPDGRRAAKLLTTPDGRGSRSVRVSFP